MNEKVCVCGVVVSEKFVLKRKSESMCMCL